MGYRGSLQYSAWPLPSTQERETATTCSVAGVVVTDPRDTSLPRFEFREFLSVITGARSR